MLEDRSELIKAVTELAVSIANKSPVATLGVKRFLNYSRDHSVEDSLEYALVWNQAMIQGPDMARAAMGQLTKTPATFDDLPGPIAKL